MRGVPHSASCGSSRALPVIRIVAAHTLEDVAEFDERGLWSHRGVWFSMVGTLLETTVAFVTASEMGYFVDELDNLLHVGTKDVLWKLVRAGRLRRHELMGRFLYLGLS